MNAQKYEDGAAVRIKFASLMPDDTLRGDSDSEYPTLFKVLRDGWADEEAGTVKTRQGSENRAWLLRLGENEVCAVAHETGLEILVVVASSVATEAVVGLVMCLWRRWGQARLDGISTDHKVESSLVIEETTDRFPDGRSRSTRRVVIRGPVNDSEVLTALGST